MTRFAAALRILSLLLSAAGSALFRGMRSRVSARHLMRVCFLGLTLSVSSTASAWAQNGMPSAPGLPLVQAEGALSCAELKSSPGLPHGGFGWFSGDARSHADPGFRVGYYGLNLDIDPDEERISGHADLLLHFPQGKARITLELNRSLHISGITDAATGAELPFTRSAGPVDFLVEIELATLPDTETQRLIRIAYEGRPGSTGFGSFVFTRRGGAPHFWSLSQPFGARDWFPNLNTPAVKADSSDVIARIPDGLTLASNGLLVRETPLPNGQTEWHWRSRYPIAHYLISVAAAPYVSFTDYFRHSPQDSLPVVNFVYPDADTPLLREQARLTLPMLALFTELFGPYPFLSEKYGHAMFGRRGGMEHQTMSSMHNFSRALVAHELAHQWFGNAVSCARWEDIWLNESFATYAEGLVIEAFDGPAAFREWRRGVTGQITAEPAGRVFVPSERIDPSAPDASVARIFRYRTSYLKGAMVLHQLRILLGDDSFFGLLRSWVQGDFLHGSATTEDFIAHAESFSGELLRGFFDTWIYGLAHAELELRYAVRPVSEHSGQGYLLRLQAATRASAEGPADWSVPLQLRIPEAGGARDTTLSLPLPSPGEPLEAEFRLPFPPAVPEPDPESHLLLGRADVFPGSFADIGRELPGGLRLLPPYPNPFNARVLIPFTLSEPAEIRAEIYDLNGRRVTVLFEGLMLTGEHLLPWQAGSAASGVYFVVMRTTGRTEVRAVTLLK